MSQNNIDEANEMIKQMLLSKASMKQDVYSRTHHHFQELKQVLRNLCEHFRKEVTTQDPRIRIEFIDKGEFEVRVFFASDVLIFQMHTNVFQFDLDNPLWKTAYLKEDDTRAYCGIINVYNFLADSFNYRREGDLGYLIGRIFINREDHFMLEGKRQLGFLYNNFINEQLTNERLQEVAQSILLYTIDFDLFTPNYELIKEITLADMQALGDAIQLRTGKRLGFKFHADTDDII